MKATRCQECGFFTETTRCQHCGSIVVVPKQPMTKDELRKGLRETFSLPNERNLFWQYIGQLEKRIAEITSIASETLAKHAFCPYEYYGWKHPKHNCKECDSINADYCFCWEEWLKERLLKEQELEK